MVKKIWFWSTSLIILALDQLSKWLVALFMPQSSIIHYVENTGAGFGILQGMTPLLALISAGVALIIIIFHHRIPELRMPQIFLGMVLGGVVGNLTDRVFRGFVIDFMDLGFWPAFNVADAALTISVMGLIIYYWKK